MPIIRDDGKAYRLYFATDTAVIFSLPGDYNPAGKTFSLAVRAVRDIHTPALAEATGTVSGQIVTFAVDTNTQSFADALAAGISQAWLEIYVGDEDVLLQRPVSIEPRAGSLEGQPPAPVVLYYTAAQTDAAISSAFSAHNGDMDAHGDIVSSLNDAITDAQGRAENFATSAVQDHNEAQYAHGGRLLAVAPNGGAIMTYRGDEWQPQTGAWMQSVTGDFTAEPGVVYGLDLAENKTIYIAAAASADFDFALVVTMGATLRSLTLLPDMVNAILWSDGGNPPDYSTANPAPALDTTLATYTLHFRYVAAENAFHAELAATKDYNLPISGTRGVFASSGTTAVVSAMVVSGAVVGADAPQTVMNVYSRGRVLDATATDGGVLSVLRGGVVSGYTHSGGQMVVYSGGTALSCDIYKDGTYISSGGYAENVNIHTGGFNVNGGSAASCYVSSGATFTTRNNGVAANVTTYAGGIVVASANSLISNLTLSGTSARIQVRGGTVVTADVTSGGILNVSSGEAKVAVVSSGGQMALLSAGSIASNTTVLSGGKLVVSSAGAALDVTSSAGAIVNVLEGGTITYKA